MTAITVSFGLTVARLDCTFLYTVDYTGASILTNGHVRYSLQCLQVYYCFPCCN